MASAKRLLAAGAKLSIGARHVDSLTKLQAQYPWSLPSMSPKLTKSNLYQTIPSKAGQENKLEVQKHAALSADDMAQAVEFAIDTPDHMSVSEIYVRPTMQPV